MMDKIFLLNSWLFLLTHIRKIIDDLQSKANKVYEEENSSCPQRHPRLSTGSFKPANFRFNRGATKPARSLADLIKDKMVFHRLHQKFTWILKAGGNRLTERLLEGPPTEDAIIDLENQEGTLLCENNTLNYRNIYSTENEDGFVVLHKLSDAPSDFAEEGMSTSIDEENNPNIPKFTSLRHVMKVRVHPHSIA
jgi:folliculin